jgi:hypothetical protein
LAAVVGALLALGIVFLIEYLDDRVQSPDDLRKIADLPVLGAIAKMPNDKDAENARSGNLIGLNEPRHPDHRSLPAAAHQSAIRQPGQ